MSAKTLLPYFTGAMRWYPVEGYGTHPTPTSSPPLTGQTDPDRRTKIPPDSSSPLQAACHIVHFDGATWRVRTEWGGNPKFTLEIE